MPTIYANRFTVSHGDVVRISFYDELDETKTKTAIALSPADAAELARIILELAERAKAAKQ